MLKRMSLSIDKFVLFMTLDALNGSIDVLKGVLDIAPSPLHLRETLTLATKPVETLRIGYLTCWKTLCDGSDGLLNAELISSMIDALDGKVEVLHDGMVIHIVLWIDVHFVSWIRSLDYAQVLWFVKGYLAHHNNIVGIHERLLIAPELSLVRVVEGNHHISEMLTGDGLIRLASGARGIEAEREILIAVFLKLLDIDVVHKTNHYAHGVVIVNT